MIIIAVDPGITGAFAVYQSENRSMRVYDIPTLSAVVNRKKRKVLDYETLAEHFRHLCIYESEAFLVIEKMRPYPHDTPVTAFKLAEIYGAFKGIAFMQDLKVIEVTPITWKNFFNLRNQDKNASLEKAKAFFPDIDLSFKKDHNRAEALLIMRYAMEGLQLQV